MPENSSLKTVTSVHQASDLNQTRGGKYNRSTDSTMSFASRST